MLTGEPALKDIDAGALAADPKFQSWRSGIGDGVFIFAGRHLHGIDYRLREFYRFSHGLSPPVFPSLFPSLSLFPRPQSKSKCAGPAPVGVFGKRLGNT